MSIITGQFLATNSRYRSPVDLSKTAYPGRKAQDQKLLAYASGPLDGDIEIAGNPIANLMLATTAPDGEVIVYFEVILPDGTPTYLTEGLLRLAHRNLPANASSTLSSDPLHTYLAAAAAPMTLSLPFGEVKPQGRSTAMRIAELRKSECRSVIGQIGCRA